MGPRRVRGVDPPGVGGGAGVRPGGRHLEHAPRPEPVPPGEDHVHGTLAGGHRRRDREPLQRPEDEGRPLPGVRDLVDRHGCRDRRLRRGRKARHLRRQQDRGLPAIPQPGRVQVRGRDREGGRRRGAGRVEPGRGVRRHQQQRQARHLRLPHQRAKPPLHQPGRRDLQGDGARVRARREGLERHGRLLRLRPRRVARPLHRDECPGRHQEPERPARVPFPQQQERHVHERDRERGHFRGVAEPLRDLVGL